MLDMTQMTLAAALGITFQQVQKYENGTNRISASRLQHIASVLKESVPFFFEGQATQPAIGLTEAPSTAYVTDFLATTDGLTLIKAFTSIKDAKVRRRIVKLVEEIAGD